MKKTTHILILILTIGILSCSHNMIDKNSILIKKVDRHPYLKNHGRKLIVKSGMIFNHKIDLYGDPGEGCNSYLSENDSSFILVDCNGEWYSIDKTKGKINRLGWNWNKDFPEKFVGVFKSVDGEIYYELSEKFNDIYKFKDPNDF